MSQVIGKVICKEIFGITQLIPLGAEHERIPVHIGFSI